MEDLKVTSVRYFRSIKGMVGYECTTNVDGLAICNEGCGGATYLDGLWKAIRPHFSLKESQLKELIDEYELNRK
jgi:hypothetical protein